MDHRKTQARKALTLPGWVIILSALICLGAASYLAFLILNDEPAKPTATATATAEPTVTTPPPTEETPTEEPTAEPTADQAKRDIPVGVFNNTTTAGLGRTVADKVEAAGWRVNGVGNWRGSIAETTVYYPPGFEEQAKTLAKDLDFSRVRPSVAPMKGDRLTLILSGPQ